MKYYGDTIEKVIRKAISRGWTVNGLINPKEEIDPIVLDGIIHHVKTNHPLFYCERDFAKAFWGGHFLKKDDHMTICTKCKTYMNSTAVKNPANECTYWQKKLQTLVLESDKVKFLKKFI